MYKLMDSDEDLQSIKQLAVTNGASFFTIEINKPYDTNAFFGAIKKTFPLDPLIAGGDNLVWDALSDSLFGGLDSLEAQQIVIVWQDHVAMQQSDPHAYNTALSVVEQVQEQLHSEIITAGKRKDVAIYLA